MGGAGGGPAAGWGGAAQEVWEAQLRVLEGRDAAVGQPPRLYGRAATGAGAGAEREELGWFADLGPAGDDVILSVTAQPCWNRGGWIPRSPPSLLLSLPPFLLWPERRCAGTVPA